MSLSVCTDVSASDWLVGQDMPWYQLSVKGPGGFPAYARLRFLPDTPFEGEKTPDAGFVESWYERNTESEQFTVVLEILSGYTSTPDDCYFCLWDGWGCEVIGDDIPMVKIPNRDYWLFRGALTDWDEWGPDAQFSPRGASDADPAFIWPADHAWCVANDVDPDFAVIAGPTEAIQLLIADPRIDAVTVAPYTPTDPDRYY
ncbi:hypothetical protein [Rhodococcus globerulus]|uniref:Uncharacterized protein n=1 Tax=Rhodococcus globerulus TaxID=33008 RepID=A0ABU4C2F2_RHOGO|nr:hypothetical protein [Rhodococcus globerulus]MDV6270672.1 hypothetical protein [Rhodococcus globerulus]